MGRKKERTDEELLGIAREVFLEHGPGVATSVIAKAAEVSQATLFNRFESKRKLMILALTPARNNPVIELLEKLPDQRPIPLQLVEIANLLYHTMKQREPAIAVLKAAGITMRECFEATENSPMIRGPQALLRWFQTAQEQGRIDPNVEPITFALAFAGSVKNLAMDEFFLPKHDEATVVHLITHLVDMLWRGLKPGEQ